MAAACAPAPIAEKIAAISTADLAARIKAGKIMLIDVREANAFAAGHISGAINKPFSRFEPKSVPQISGRETVLYCRTGRYAAEAAKRLAGVRGAATYLKGGIFAWQNAGQPITK